jgi:hypothetical protein
MNILGRLVLDMVSELLEFFQLRQTMAVFAAEAGLVRAFFLETLIVKLQKIIVSS